jgi:AraC-like DNA-binding protein
MADVTYYSAANPEGDAGSNSNLHVLFAGASQTEAEHKLGPKIYNYYLLHFIEHGKGQFVNDSIVYTLQAGDCFLIPPNQLVSYASDPIEPWRYRWIAFSGIDAEALIQEAGFTPQITVFTPGADSEISKILFEVLEAFHDRKLGANLLSLGYLYLIMGEAKETLLKDSPVPVGETVVQRIVKQMIHYMSSQYAYPISIEQMCHSLGYNRAYLSRIFRKETGTTPVSYLLKLRIEKSRQLLRGKPELSIEQIAASVGMTDPLYFSRQFRKIYGKSPSDYRKSVTRKSQ